MHPERRRLITRAYAAARRLAERLGIQFVVRGFYSPIPELRSLPDEVWTGRSDLAGIELDLDRQVELVKGVLSPYLREFDVPEESSGRPGEPFLANESFGHVDADVLYALIRQLKPRTILELGSGHSTLFMARAVQANARDGAETALESFDPFPSVARDGLPGLARLHAVPAQEVPVSTFDRLRSGDMLVVDTTHVVKLGSDVNYVVLDVLPRLSPGVVVHFHDVFLPYEAPRHFAEQLGLYWSEQYLLQAFLALNSDYEVMLALHALARERPEALAKAVRSWEARPGWGSSFYIRRREPERIRSEH